MSREIKFRAWHKELKCMALVARIDFVNRTVDLFTPDEPAYDISFDDIELMQYTGLEDKSGKEIYEGDIIKATGWASGQQHVVKFEEGRFKPNTVLSNTEFRCKIIGNDPENPELLKGSKQAIADKCSFMRKDYG